MLKNFNDNHPEIRKEEIFLQNVIAPRFGDLLRALPGLDFNKIEYSTKRMGRTAYDCDGKVLPLARPVFVSRAEHDFEDMQDKESCECS